MIFKLTAASVAIGSEDLEKEDIQRFNHRYLKDLQAITTVQVLTPFDGWHSFVLINIPDLNTLMRVIKTVKSEVIVGESYGNLSDKFPYTITIYDGCL